MCSYKSTKEQILRDLRYVQIRILEVEQIVKKQEVGTIKVNGDSKELKQRVIKELRDSNSYTKEELEQLIKRSLG